MINIDCIVYRLERFEYRAAYPDCYFDFMVGDDPKYLLLCRPTFAIYFVFSLTEDIGKSSCMLIQTICFTQDYKIHFIFVYYSILRQRKFMCSNIVLFTIVSCGLKGYRLL